MNLILRSAALACGALVIVATPASTPANPYMIPGPIQAAAGDYMQTSLSTLLGRSGNLRAVFGTPASLLQNPVLGALLSGRVFGAPGTRPFELSSPDGARLAILLLQPFVPGQAAQLSGYRVGRWHPRAKTALGPQYAAPEEFIPVTPENEMTPVSKSFVLRDFVTHDQQSVWPKVLVLRTALLDKLELIGGELERRGLPNKLHVMSGFRTPQYNAQGVGPRGGRARDSRHMYGDAADVIVDANGDGRMDDLNGDGRITVRDARVLYAVAEGVEAQHPELVGGLSAYASTPAHGPFVHVDTRGVRARW